MTVHQLINKDNWHKGSANNGKGAFCLISHIYNVYGPYERGGSYIVSFLRSEMIKKGLIDRTSGIQAFNDNPKTTLEDVISLCKEYHI